MRDTGKLETIHEAKDERGSTMTTVLRGHASDVNFKNTLGPALSTMQKIGETQNSVTEEDPSPNVMD